MTATMDVDRPRTAAVLSDDRIIETRSLQPRHCRVTPIGATPAWLLQRLAKGSAVTGSDVRFGPGPSLPVLGPMEKRVWWLPIRTSEQTRVCTGATCRRGDQATAVANQGLAGLLQRRSFG